MSAGHKLTVALEVQGPVFSAATGKPKFGLDATQARSGDKPILPGSHIKGHLRHVFEQAKTEGVPGIDDDWIVFWFGKPSGSVGNTGSGSFQAASGHLSVGDLTAEASGDGVVTRIAIDEGRGSVRDGMMQFVEAPWTYGETVKFKGELNLWGATTESCRNQLLANLAWAFQLIPAVGAFKTAGFGQLKGVVLGGTWSPLPVATGASGAKAFENAGGADLQLRPLKPFLVWSYSHSGNFFAGDRIIPGQVLKAVAARWLYDRGLLKNKKDKDLFARLIFRHAHPVPRSAPGTPRPISIPLSIYKVDDGKEPVFADVLENPAYFRGYAAMATVTFKPDWKDLPQKLAARYGPRVMPRRDSRTRTAVDNNVAADEQLFTQVGVDPNGCIWRGQILIPPDAASDERNAMAALIAALAGTSLGLGKTKAPMEWKPEPLTKQPTADKHESGWRVVLQTPACLHGPHDSRCNTGDSMVALRADYEAYWSQVLDGAGRLVDFMARQRLAGGYLARRYPVPSNGYEPYLLTEEGSVFLIEECKSGLPNRLRAFSTTGLPLGPGWQQRNWTNHPFLPEAGWGEVWISDESPIPADEPQADGGEMEQEQGETPASGARS